MIESGSQTQSNQDKLLGAISSLISPIGFELVHLEILTGRQKLLRLYIDHLDQNDLSRAPRGIGIEDCAAVSKALDGPLDELPEVDKVFGGGAYELEVSSPGVDRPLRQAKDYERFSGHEARIHVFRPLTAEEIENPGYQSKNPKQKNFIGVLKGLRAQKILLALPKAGQTNVEILIPLALISKANLEPHFDLHAKETT